MKQEESEKDLVHVLKEKKRLVELLSKAEEENAELVMKMKYQIKKVALVSMFDNFNSIHYCSCSLCCYQCFNWYLVKHVSP